ncbi:hypothetical protein CKA38_02870 [Ereboglobus luteus]|uniref:Uncharacterized protein n=1 Tax=Ereboglobus luteus TaxID=1796921 RepID=A0A2U8E0K3_9BACT|nr:hypothetical protein CKA38_02870 [Ereboglobus luteus]
MAPAQSGEFEGVFQGAIAWPQITVRGRIIYKSIQYFVFLNTRKIRIHRESVIGRKTLIRILILKRRCFS